jgi:LysR family transcriptional regulator, regulator of abg operon
MAYLSNRLGVPHSSRSCCRNSPHNAAVGLVTPAIDKIPPMKLNHIRDIVSIADRGSLRAAAQYLGLAQPALTRSVRELEHELGVVLFERHARGMALTQVGEAFVARMRIVQTEIQRSREEIGQKTDHPIGHVSVGLSMVATIVLLPNMIGQFKSRFPKVQLKVVEGLFPDLRQRIVDGTLDFYVGPMMDHTLPRELVVESLFANELVILGRKGHPLRAARSMATLVGASWIGFRLSDSSEMALGRYFRRQGLPPPHIGIDVTSALAAFIAAAHTDLLAMLPQKYTRHPGAADLLERIKVKEKLGTPGIYLVTRSGLPLTPAAEFLSDLIRRSATREVERREVSDGVQAIDPCSNELDYNQRDPFVAMPALAACQPPPRDL